MAADEHKSDSQLLREIHGDLKAVCQRVGDHHKTLYGNGSKGLDRRVEAVEATQQQCPGRSTAKTRHYSKMFWAQVAMTAITAGLLIVAIIKLSPT